MKKKLLFIINPKAGGNNVKTITKSIQQHVSPADFDFEVVFTKEKRHATELSSQAVKEGFDIVMSVGGDGTMNEVASGLTDSKTALGILPTGSGNGLARHLKIPMNVAQSLKSLKNMKFTTIDSCTLNEQPFFCTAGTGFDAHVGKKFEEKGHRGFYTYLQTTAEEVFQYKPKPYKLYIDGKVMENQALLMSFTNAGQFGNNAYISPNADLMDGLVDVCMMLPFPAWQALPISIQLFNKALHRSPYLKIFQTSEAVVERMEPTPVHLDGEVRQIEGRLSVKVLPKNLRVWAP